MSVQQPSRLGVWPREIKARVLISPAHKHLQTVFLIEYYASKLYISA